VYTGPTRNRIFRRKGVTLPVNHRSRGCRELETTSNCRSLRHIHKCGAIEQETHNGLNISDIKLLSSLKPVTSLHITTRRDNDQDTSTEFSGPRNLLLVSSSISQPKFHNAFRASSYRDRELSTWLRTKTSNCADGANHSLTGRSYYLRTEGRDSLAQDSLARMRSHVWQPPA
jgi:hypothetical protein